MPRKTISIGLSLFFLVFLTAPTVLSVIDSSIDVSCFFTSSEEEDKNIENLNDFEGLFSDSCFGEFDLASSDLENDVRYFYKNYTRPHLYLISPPPKLLPA